MTTLGASLRGLCTIEAPFPSVLDILGNPALSEADLNYEDERGKTTPLTAACLKGRLDIVEELLKDPRVNVNHQNQQGLTPLLAAVKSKSLQIVQSLLAQPQLNPNLALKSGGPPLCESPTLEITRKLLADPRVDVNQARADGQTALMQACSTGNINVLSFLLQHPRLVLTLTHPSQLHASLVSAAGKGLIGVLGQLLADPRVDPAAVLTEGGAASLVVVASLHNRSAVVKMLLKDGRIDPNHKTRRGVTALCTACERSSVRVTQALLADPRVDPNLTNHRGETPLHLACLSGEADSPRLLLADLRVNPNTASESGETPFLAACMRGSFDLALSMAQDARVDVNGGESCPVVVACYRRDQDLALFLLSCDRIQASPYVLQTAAATGQAKVLEALLADPKADVNSFDLHGETAFFKATRYGNPEIVTPLLRHSGVDVNARLDLTRFTPLMEAAYHGHTEAVQLIFSLRGNGVDTEARTTLDDSATLSA